MESQAHLQFSQSQAPKQKLQKSLSSKRTDT